MHLSMFSIQLNLSRALNFQPIRMRSSVNHASSQAEKSKNEYRAIKKISRNFFYFQADFLNRLKNQPISEKNPFD